MSIKIVTETGCDLPSNLVAAYDIHLVPLVVRLGDRDLLDTEASRRELWEHIDAGLPCQTSGPPIGAYQEVLRPLVEAGHEVVCITLTSAHSGSYNSAWAAAQFFSDRVTVIDSRSISLGYGLQVLAAARLAASGASKAEVVAAVEAVQQHSRIRFFLESLGQARRGGRLDGLLPMLERLGRTLNIRAVLTVNSEGRISLVGPARGRRGASKRLLQDAIAAGPAAMIGVVHTRQPEEAHALADRLATELNFPRREILVAEAGSVFIVHAGEGALGVVTVSR